MPGISEANSMSIELDKKVKFEVIVVSAELRGEYNGKIKVKILIIKSLFKVLNTFKPMVLVKNFSTGYEWIWTKENFLNRKELMSQYYADIRDNGKIDQDRFKVNNFILKELPKIFFLNSNIKLDDLICLEL